MTTTEFFFGLVFIQCFFRCPRTGVDYVVRWTRLSDHQDIVTIASAAYPRVVIDRRGLLATIAATFHLRAVLWPTNRSDLVATTMTEVTFGDGSTSHFTKSGGHHHCRSSPLVTSSSSRSKRSLRHHQYGGSSMGIYSTNQWTGACGQRRW